MMTVGKLQEILDDVPEDAIVTGISVKRTDPDPETMRVRFMFSIYAIKGSTNYKVDGTYQGTWKQKEKAPEDTFSQRPVS